jgi:urease accessory protein
LELVENLLRHWRKSCYFSHMNRLSRLVKTGGILLALPALAQAHPGHDGHDLTWDFSGGFAHPLSGWDHLLAMIAVGLWAAQLGGRARWLVPAAFVTVMALGAALGRTGAIFPGVEQGIAASVLVLGLLIAAAVRLPVTAGMTLVGVFAIFHGFAHGVEMPATAGGLLYGAGFVVATALLHAIGVGLGVLAARTSANATKLAGWAIAASGVMLFAL